MLNILKKIIPLLTIVMIATPSHASIYLYKDQNGATFMTNKKVKRPGLSLFNIIRNKNFIVTRYKKGTLFNKQQIYTLINKTAKHYNIDPHLFHSLIQAESNYNPHATSHKGAAGLTQLMPDTAKRMGVKDRYDITQNLAGGAKYLKLLLNLYNGNKILSIAAYNAGEGAVKKYNGIPPFKETRNYVKKVLTNYLKQKQSGTFQNGKYHWR